MAHSVYLYNVFRSQRSDTMHWRSVEQVSVLLLYWGIVLVPAVPRGPILKQGIVDNYSGGKKEPVGGGRNGSSID